MKPKRVQISHNKNGFSLHVEEYSRFYSGLATVADRVCQLTGHRFCHSLLSYFENKDWKHSKDLVVVPITRDQADLLSRKDAWEWLDA